MNDHDSIPNRKLQVNLETPENFHNEIKQPSLELLGSLSEELGFDLSRMDLVALQALMRGALHSYEVVANMQQPELLVRYPRMNVRVPNADENPLNAWYYKCSIKGASDGILHGKRVVVKDNICVAEVPMMNGSKVLEGYVPEIDASIVTRVLEAGAEIVGKGVSENLSFGGSSFTSDTGPVHNPHNHQRSSGGSTSGPAALVAAGEADLAIGADQGGSIRIPSAWCGIYGLKPTFGLVPYTGISQVELTQDHAGPLAANVSDLAALLEVIAGVDGLDPRQNNIRIDTYTQSLHGEVRGLRIGVLEEGFDWPGVSEKDVDNAVRDAANRLSRLGVEVKRISVPMHRQAHHIWRVIAVEGRTIHMWRGRGMGTNWKGHYTLSLLDAYAHGFREKPQLLSETVKLIVLLGEAMLRRYDGQFYARAQNLGRVLKQAYDVALNTVDALLLPTAPMKATPLPDPKASLEERFTRSLEMTPNTNPFNVTGHPALSIPCALSNYLPVGMMLVGRFWEEKTLLRLAAAYEALGVYPVGHPAPFTH